MAIGETGIVKAIPAVIVALALAGCSTSASAPPSGTAQPSSSFGQKIENLLLLGDANPPPPQASSERTRVFCPELAIQPGTAALDVYEPGHQGDPFSQRYQARFGRLARQCDVNGETVTVKIGFAGRVVIGPKGQSGQTVTLPVRIVLLNGDDRPVFSRLEPVAVAVPAGSGGADFRRIVSTDPIPLPADRMGGWRLRIGFDTGKAAKPGHSVRRHRARRAR